MKHKGNINKYIILIRVCSPNGDSYEFFSNGIWNIVVAMTTVGYGDFYPKSHFGRTILVIAVSMGTVITSLTVVALNKISSFDSEEERAYIVLKRLNFREKLNHSCQKIISTNFKLFQLKKSINRKDLMSSNLYSKLLYSLSNESYSLLSLKRLIEKDLFISDLDKFRDLDCLIRSNISDIQKNLMKMGEIKIRLKKQAVTQKILIDNIKSTLQITRDQ